MPAFRVLLAAENRGLVWLGPRTTPDGQSIDHVALSPNGLWLVRVEAPPSGRVERRDLGDWFTVLGSSALVSVELGLSGTVPLTPSLFAMVGVHALIGLVEGGITVAVVRFVERVRPETLEGTALQREAA